MWNFLYDVLKVRKLQWFMQYKPGRITVALKQPSWCILTWSGWAIELPPSYSHTCPHLKSAEDMCTQTHTHTHSRLNALYGLEPSHEAAQHIWLFQSQKLWNINPGNSEQQTDLPPVNNHDMLSTWKSDSYHVTFTFQEDYRCNICVVPCRPFSLFSSRLMKRQ